MVYVINEEDVVYVFNTVEWRREEIASLKDYCLMNRITSISELVYIMMAMVHSSSNDEFVNFASSRELRVSVKFSSIPLVSLSHSFFDEVFYAMENIKRVNIISPIILSDGRTIPTGEMELMEWEEFYEHCVEASLKVFELIINIVPDHSYLDMKAGVGGGLGCIVTKLQDQY